MTEKLFWSDPYLTSTTSKVTSVNDTEVELARTIIFAQSGGQESDYGTIGGIPVANARKIGKEIIYTLDAPPTFQAGDTVQLQIDWQRRYGLMKLHFAAEIVLELFMQLSQGFAKIGAHISQDKSRIDFAWPESIGPLLPGIQQKAQQLIARDLAIESNFLNREEELRYWKIDGFAQVPCGGTHLKRTSEIGEILLKRNNIGKGKERVEITLCPTGC